MLHRPSLHFLQIVKFLKDLNIDQSTSYTPGTREGLFSPMRCPFVINNSFSRVVNDVFHSVRSVRIDKL